jgi:hypothetical protein
MENSLNKIFAELKSMLGKDTPPLTEREDKVGGKKKYDLWSKKEVVIAKRPRKEVFFASIIIQKSYVGFYFMPIYVNSKMSKVFKPELLSLLRGKSCFHIKKLDKKLSRQIKFALEEGFKLYKRRGWI